ncbi:MULTISPECIES: LysR family transcriptional regulator [Pseudomonas putida group]|uniref:LysR family transcriptional regulator n=1 Tax=Pseudomonas mosselii TaxID=78327 RepID=A0A5R8ZH60_9PSED|nr:MULTISPECIES: LysR family transcriptional regulator [Pseudomonas putida group]MBH3459212.1 LysR family transcriptional regulator [Pseudomonas putida]TLP65108.1 LysR family transcriptional regulator [Pseudomonas mosselii]
MNTKLLETFVELARTPHLRKLAERLHATPSALSMRVKNLEEQLGVSLFTSDNKTLSLTEEGRRLLPYAEAAIASLQEFIGAASQVSGVGGVVRVGLIEAAVYTLLPELVRRTKADLPNVNVTWVVGLTADLLEQLNKGELDLVLSLDRQPQNPYAVAESLLTLATRWIGKTGLVQNPDEESFIFSHQILTPMGNTAPSDDAARTVQKLAFKYGVNPTTIQLSSSPSISALITLIRNGIGIGVLPAVLVKEYLANGELEVLPVTPPPPMVIHRWHLTNASPATLKVAEVVSVVASHLDEADSESVCKGPKFDR